MTAPAFAGLPAVASNPPAPSVSLLSGLGSMLLTLLLVMALIMVLAWLLKRLPGANPRNRGVLRVVASLPVGVKERVMVVDVAGSQMLLGVTATRISLLHRLEQPLSVAHEESFSTLLRRARRRAGEHRE